MMQRLQQWSWLAGISAVGALLPVIPFLVGTGSIYIAGAKLHLTVWCLIACCIAVIVLGILAELVARIVVKNLLRPTNGAWAYTQNVVEFVALAVGYVFVYRAVSYGGAVFLATAVALVVHIIIVFGVSKLGVKNSEQS